MTDRNDFEDALAFDWRKASALHAADAGPVLLGLVFETAEGPVRITVERAQARTLRTIVTGWLSADLNKS